MSVGIITGNVKAMGVAQVSLDLASVNASTAAEQDLTVPGLKVGDAVFVNKPSATTGVIVGNARVKAADTLSLTIGNFTTDAQNVAAETYTILWVRPDSVATGVSA